MVACPCAEEPPEAELPGLPDAAAPALLMTSQHKEQTGPDAEHDDGKTSQSEAASQQDGVAEVRLALQPDSVLQLHEQDDAAEETSQLLPRQ